MRRPLRLDDVARVGIEPGEDRPGVAIDERMPVAHEHRESHAHPDLFRRPRDGLGFLDRRHRAVEAGVMRHDRTRPGARGAGERGERAEVRVDRRHRAELQ